MGDLQISFLAILTMLTFTLDKALKDMSMELQKAVAWDCQVLPQIST